MHPCHPTSSDSGEGTMISTVVHTRQCYGPRAWAIVGAIALFACGGHNALAQSSVPTGGFLEHEAVMPPPLFREVWQPPRPLDDENRRITPQALTNPDLEYPDLSRVDEIGFVDLMPGGGHGFAGCSNVSSIEVYATPRKR